MEKFWRGLKEWIRKRVVYVKRHPQIIPMLFLAVACIVFTFKLSDHSTTNMLIVTNDAIALNLFITTLLSFLSVISFLGFNGFKNKKSIAMGGLTVVFSVVQIVLQVYFISAINFGLYGDHNKTVRPSPIIDSSLVWLVVHIVFLGLFLLAFALLPVYSRLLSKIKTTAPEQQRLQSAAIENQDDLIIEEI